MIKGLGSFVRKAFWGSHIFATPYYYFFFFAAGEATEAFVSLSGAGGKDTQTDQQGVGGQSAGEGEGGGVGTTQKETSGKAVNL